MRAVLLLSLVVAGCAIHAVEFQLVEQDRWDEFHQLANQVAAEFSMGDMHPGRTVSFKDSDGSSWLSLAHFARNSYGSSDVPGSAARLDLLVFVSEPPGIVRVRLNDYNHGEETPFARDIRLAIERRLFELVPRDRVQVKFERGRGWAP